MIDGGKTVDVKIDTRFNSIQISNIESIFDKLSNICPYGKVAIFCLKESFVSFGLELANKLKHRQFKVVSVILEKYQTLNTKEVFGLLNLPEDVRAVVVLDKDFYDLSLYFCSINKMPILFYSIDCLYYGGLDNLVFIKNGEFLDKVPVHCDRYLFLDDKIDSMQLIISLGNAILSVLEYLFNSVEQNYYIDKTVEQIISLINNLVDKIDKGQTNDIIKQFIDLTICLIESGVYDCIITSKLCCFALNGKFNQVENAFLFANNILNRISDNLSKVSKQNLKIVDYNLILERISRELNINKKQILQGLSNEKLLINHLTKRLDYLQCNLTKLRQLINKTYEIYKKFGGKQEWNTAKINAAVSIAGFLNGYTTLLQFFREFNF